MSKWKGGGSRRTCVYDAFDGWNVWCNLETDRGEEWGEKKIRDGAGDHNGSI